MDETQFINSKFQYPEFYSNGTVIIIEGEMDQRIHVRRDGDARLVVGDLVLSTPDHFRENFQDGVLPSDDYDNDIVWTYNAWFDLYRETEDGLEHLDCIHYEVAEAIEQAKVLLADYSSRVLENRGWD